MSIEYLKEHKNVINIHLSDLTNSYDNETLIIKKHNWPGFTFNPTLKRMRDYKLIKGGYTSKLIYNNT